MTPAALTAIPILQFRAGELRLGIVAAAVTRLGEVAPECPHLGTLLGLGGAGPGQVPLPEVPRCLLMLKVSDRATRVVVDGPVLLGNIEARDLLPTARSLHRLLSRAVIGFAKDQEHLMLLLDVVWLVDHLARSELARKSDHS